jgi:hypothetical protein
MSKRNRSAKSDTTIEVSDTELTPASPPPLPTKTDLAESPGLASSRAASALLPAVRATLRFVKSLEARLVQLEARLAISAARSQSSDAPQLTDQPRTA